MLLLHSVLELLLSQPVTEMESEHLSTFCNLTAANLQQAVSLSGSITITGTCKSSPEPRVTLKQGYDSLPK